MTPPPAPHGRRYPALRRFPRPRAGYRTRNTANDLDQQPDDRELDDRELDDRES
ncbi:hypothetical protein [Amycolatopsis sp.]|uniref:hypothetical protein n=1 Tax=Amycolatopsis sp. TaxID=37632 RepID=UPI00260697A1|nr:hypothetical protein [Amycolatopsis sp.]